MNTQFTVKAENSSDLVQGEKYLEDSKNQIRKALVDQYMDLVEWLMMLQKQPYIEIADEYIKQIIMAYQMTNKIQGNIDQQETNLKQQRDEIEKKLMVETKAFQDELNDIK